VRGSKPGPVFDETLTLASPFGRERRPKKKLIYEQSLNIEL